MARSLPMVGYKPKKINTGINELDDIANDPASVVSLPYTITNATLNTVGNAGPDSPDMPGAPQFNTDFPEAPATPELVPYTGNTRVPLGPGYYKTAQTAMGLLKPGSAYSTVLSGDPNMELFNQAVAIPSSQQLVGQTLPMIASSFSGSPYGPSYYSGATQRAQQEAIVKQADDLAKLRLQYSQQATQDMLRAAGLLPQIGGVFQQGFQNRSSNLNREIEVFYKNQGLEQQEFQNEMATTQYALQVLGMENAYALADYEIQAQNAAYEAAQNASQMQFLGTLAGGGLGLALGGPIGGAVGGSLGSAAGGFLGGGTPSTTAAGTQNLTSALNTYALLSSIYGGGTTPVAKSTGTDLGGGPVASPLSLPPASSVDTGYLLPASSYDFGAGEGLPYTPSAYTP